MVALNVVEKKNIQTEVKHRDDVARANTARANVSDSQARVQLLQKAFWKELTHVSRELQSVRRDSRSALGESMSKFDTSPDRTRALFGRLQSIKGEMTHAHRELSAAQRSFDGAVSVAIRSGSTNRGLQQLISAMRRRVTCRAESRMQDEVADGVGAHRGARGGAHLGALRTPILGFFGPGPRPPELLSRTAAPSGVSKNGISTKVEVVADGQPVEREGVEKGQNTFQPPDSKTEVAFMQQACIPQVKMAPEGALATRESFQLTNHGIASSQRGNSPAVGGSCLSDITHLVNGEDHSLSMQCKLEGGSMVALRVSGAKEGPIRVVVSGPISSTSSTNSGASSSIACDTLGRHTAALLQRLRSSGLNVDKIEVSSVPSILGESHTETRGAGYLSGRRRTYQGEVYE